MTTAFYNENSWHQLSADVVHSYYCIPAMYASLPQNRFFSTCPSTPPDSCWFVAFEETLQPIYSIVLHLGSFDLEDLYELYEPEFVEAESFNYLDVIDGAISVNKKLGLGLVNVLDYVLTHLKLNAQKEQEKCSFRMLTKDELLKYRIPQLKSQTSEVYKIDSEKCSVKDGNLTTLLSFSHASNKPRQLGMGLMQFSESDFKNNPHFDVTMHGVGKAHLTFAGLTALKSLIMTKLKLLDE